MAAYAGEPPVEPFLSLQPKKYNLREEFSRKCTKIQKFGSKITLTHFFEGCRKWGKVKRDLGIMQAHREFGGFPITIFWKAVE